MVKRMTPRADPLADPEIRTTKLDTEILIVGAGISGIGAGIELVRRGIRSFVLLEASGELGGTWRDNTYPGVAVDIPSSSYCFSFETDYPWSRVFASGREILSYVQHCARKYGIYRHIRHNSTARRAQFDTDSDRWSTHLIDGVVVTSRYLIVATGLFRQAKLPEITRFGYLFGKSHAQLPVGPHAQIFGRACCDHRNRSVCGSDRA